MTPEELLQPRIKVIERWPEMDKQNHYCGQVLTLTEKEGDQWFIDTGKSKLYDAYFEGYPHLFKKLEWREDRDITDMPQYLKYLNEDGEIDFVLKVEKYIPSEVRGNQYWAFEYKWQNEPDIKRMSLQGWTPATEEEYLNTIKPH